MPAAASPAENVTACPSAMPTSKQLGHHPIQRASGRHRGRNADDTVVDPCELQNRLAENILIERGTAAFGMLHPLPGLGIEHARRMPYPLVLFGRPVALALDRQHMQQLRCPSTGPK